MVPGSATQTHSVHPVPQLVVASPRAPLPVPHSISRLISRVLTLPRATHLPVTCAAKSAWAAEAEEARRLSTERDASIARAEAAEAELAEMRQEAAESAREIAELTLRSTRADDYAQALAAQKDAAAEAAAERLEAEQQVLPPPPMASSPPPAEQQVLPLPPMGDATFACDALVPPVPLSPVPPRATHTTRPRSRATCARRTRAATPRALAACPRLPAQRRLDENASWRERCDAESARGAAAAAAAEERLTSKEGELTALREEASSRAADAAERLDAKQVTPRSSLHLRPLDVAASPPCHLAVVPSCLAALMTTCSPSPALLHLPNCRSFL